MLKALPSLPNDSGVAQFEEDLKSIDNDAVCSSCVSSNSYSVLSTHACDYSALPAPQGSLPYPSELRFRH